MLKSFANRGAVLKSKKSDKNEQNNKYTKYKFGV